MAGIAAQHTGLRWPVAATYHHLNCGGAVVVLQCGNQGVDPCENSAICELTYCMPRCVKSHVANWRQRV